MRIGYLDTSVLVAIAFGEPGSGTFASGLASLEYVVSSTLLESEFIAAAEREGLREEARVLLQPLGWVHPDRRLTAEIDRVLSAGRVRGADLHHLATALYVFPDPEGVSFISLDRRQARIARKLGFDVGDEFLSRSV